jgi:uncharacterized protein YqeY
MLEKQIEQDLKTALLGGDQLKVSTLRSIKSALLYLKVEKGKRDSGLSSEEELAILSKEAKKRTESAELYLQGGNKEKAETELAEKAIIDQYLPKQLSEEELLPIVRQVIAELQVQDMSGMGQVIAAVKQKTTGAADGSVIARLVKENLS